MLSRETQINLKLLDLLRDVASEENTSLLPKVYSNPQDFIDDYQIEPLDFGVYVSGCYEMQHRNPFAYDLLFYEEDKDELSPVSEEEFNQCIAHLGSGLLDFAAKNNLLDVFNKKD